MRTNLLKSTILSSLFIGIFMTGFAQNPQARPTVNPETNAKTQTKKMKEVISFDDKQEKKVYELNLDHAKKRNELIKTRESNRGQMRTKMDKLRAEYDAELKTILNKEQFKTYLKEKENLQRRPTTRQGQNRPQRLNQSGGGR